MRAALFVLLCVTPAALADGIPAEMRACEQDGDCVVLPDPCGTPSAVHRAHLEAAKKLLPQRNCLFAKVEHRAICHQQRCTLASVGLGAGKADGGHDPTGHAYDQPAEVYARHFDDPKRDGWQKPKHVVELLGVAPGMTVVDLGAGTGYFVGHLDRAVGETGRVLAIDVTPTFVDYLTARGRRDGWKRVTPKLAARDDPGLEPGSIDRVLIVDTWHHISRRDAYARKLAAALRPGGAVVIVEVTPESPHGPGPKHRMAPKLVLKELTGAGLEAKVVREKLPWQYVVVARKPAS